MRLPLALLVLACLSLAAPASATVYNANLLVNGDAESDVPSASGTTVIPSITGWTRIGNLTTAAYTAGAGFPDVLTPGPLNRGLAFFAGGPNALTSELSQSINVNDKQTDVDFSHVNYVLSGFLGGFSSQNDNARLIVTFQDAFFADISADTIGPVMAADRGNVTQLLRRTKTALLPVGTRVVRARLLMARDIGPYNDGYADSLDFRLQLNTLDVPTSGSSRAQLMPVIPDPVRDRAQFGFKLAKGSHVRLDVIDVQGRSQGVVLDGYRDEGMNRVEWRPTAGVRPGMYFLRLHTGSETRIQRFVLLD